MIPDESIFSVGPMRSTELMKCSYTVAWTKVIDAGANGRDDTLMINELVE